MCRVLRPRLYLPVSLVLAVDDAQQIRCWLGGHCLHCRRRCSSNPSPPPDDEHKTLYKTYITRKRNPSQSISPVKKEKKIKIKSQIIDDTGGDTGFSGKGGSEGVGVGAL